MPQCPAANCAKNSEPGKNLCQYHEKQMNGKVFHSIPKTSISVDGFVVLRKPDLTDTRTIIQELSNTEFAFKEIQCHFNEGWTKPNATHVSIDRIYAICCLRIISTVMKPM